jgi:multiple sugar transport system substrate-binding protein
MSTVPAGAGHSARQMGQAEPGPAPARSRRDFLRLVGAATAAAALGACGSPSPQPTSRQPEPVRLVYQDWRTEWFPPMAQQMLGEFHASHPNVRVFYTADPEDLEVGMVADFEAGTAPDVFQGCCTHFPAWAQKGYTLDLRPYIRADLDQETLDDWDPAQFQGLSLREGPQFGLPKYHGALALYFNKDLLEKAGVDHPDASWDHDDYQAAMARLAADRDGDGFTDLWGSLMDISWDRIQVHVNGWGGHLVDPRDPSRCTMTEPRALAAMEWLRRRMWDDRTMATPRDIGMLQPRQAFAAQRVAMVEDGSWALKDILSQASFRVGVAPFPAGPARRATLATTDGFGIYAGTRNPEAAWELVKFLISREYGRAMARASLLQPARASLVSEWVSIVRQEFPQKAADMNLAAFAAGQLEGYSVTAEIADNMLAVKQAADAQWERIFTLGQAPVQQVEEVCRRMVPDPRGAK